MWAALEETGGHYAQFAGDGLMALYGLESGVEVRSAPGAAGRGGDGAPAVEPERAA